MRWFFMKFESFCRNFLFCRYFDILEDSEVLSAHGDMFSGKGSLFFVKFQNLRDVIGVMLGRIRVEIGRDVIFAFIDLRDKLL
jgi:hypothetical protein